MPATAVLLDIIKPILEDSQFAENVAWTRRYFQENDTIINIGDCGQTLYFIESGTLRVTLNVTLSQEQQKVQPGVKDLQTGDIFGESSLFTATKRTASIKAVTEGQLIEINGAHLLSFLDAHPMQGYLLFKNLFAMQVSRLDSANRHIEHLLAWGLKAHGIDKHL